MITRFTLLKVLFLTCGLVVSHFHMQGQTGNWTDYAATGFAEGSGTSTDAYRISSAGELACVAKQVNEGNDFAGVYFRLTADIDLGAHNWVPIGRRLASSSTTSVDDKEFNGVFLGGNKVIRNLVTPFTQDPGMGLFSYIGSNGTVSGVSVIDCNIGGSNLIGGICGYNEGRVNSCYVSGIINCGSYRSILSETGGICGHNEGTIENCLVQANVTGLLMYVGGICGGNNGYLYNNCAMGAVTGSRYVGGIAGMHYSYANAEIRNCVALQEVITATDGGDAARIATGANAGKVSNNCAYENMLVNGSTVTGSTADGTGKTLEELMQGNTYTNLGWSLPSIWKIDEGAGFPYLAIQTDPVRIASSGRTGISGSYEAVAGVEITLMDQEFHVLGNAGIDTGNETWSYDFDGDVAGKVYVEIREEGKAPSVRTSVVINVFGAGTGTSSDPFVISSAAELEAAGKYLNDIYYFILNNDIDLSGYDNWNLIGKNTTYYFNSKFDGNGKTVKNMTIDRPEASNQGLFGCTGPAFEVADLGVTHAKVTGNASVGIIAGYNQGTVTRCFAVGEVTANSNAGGICGYLRYGAVSECFSSGIFTGTADYTGGLVGYAYYSAIRQCYSTMNIKSGKAGICGYLYNSAVDQCWFAGINGNATIRAAQSGTSSVTNCYYDQPTIISLSVSGGGTGLSTNEFTANTLPGGLDPQYWQAAERYYPQLKTFSDNSSAPFNRWSAMSVIPLFLENDETYLVTTAFSLPDKDAAGQDISWSGSGYCTITDGVVNTSISTGYEHLTATGGEGYYKDILFRVSASARPSVTVTPDFSTSDWIDKAVFNLSSSLTNHISGPIDFQYQKGLSGEWQYITGTLFTFSESGSYDLYFRAVTKSGNSGSTSQRYSVKVDASDPVISFDIQDAMTGYSNPAYLKTSINDAHSGIASAYAVFEGSEQTIPLENPNYDLPLDEGEYRVTVTAVDQVGNTADRSVKVMIDRTAPVISSASATLGLGSNIYLSASATDERSGISDYQWSLSSGSGGEFTAIPEATTPEYVYSAATTDHYNFRISVTDKAGNVSHKNTSVIVTSATDSKYAGIRVYPNPVALNGKLKVELTDDLKEVVISVINSAGVTVRKQYVTDKMMKMDGFAVPGLYIMKIEASGKLIATFKIIVD